MYIDRLGICIMLAGGVGLGCGGNNAQEPPPKGPDPAAATPAPAPAASTGSAAAAAEPAASHGSNPKAICDKVTTKPAASQVAPASADEVKLAGLGPLSKPVSGEFPSARNAKEGAGKEYKLSDLKALAAKGQWEELLDHIEDVPPAKRGAEWDALLERAATELLAQYGSESSSYSAFRSAEQLVGRYPALAKSERFMAKRFAVSKTAFQNCLTESYDGAECLKAMRDFLKVGSPPPDVAFQFGKLVRGKLNHYLAVPFFQRALAGKPANSPECSDQDLGLAVKAGLGLPPEDENARFSREIAGERCFATLQTAVVAQLVAGGSDSYDAQNICSVLKAKGAL